MPATFSNQTIFKPDYQPKTEVHTVSTLQNITFDEITIGQTTAYSKTLTEDLVSLFAVVSGDSNPVHLDQDYAATTQFGERIAHGAWLGALVSAAIALQLPGPGSVLLNQNITFRKPVKIGDTITVNLEVTEMDQKRRFVYMACRVVNQDGVVVARGTTQTLAPSQKLTLETPPLPTVRIGN